MERNHTNFWKTDRHFALGRSRRLLVGWPPWPAGSARSARGIPKSLAYALLTVILALASTAFTLNGAIGIHDPSTVINDHGTWYVYGTGGRALVSRDGWTWSAGVTPARTGLAPDVIHIGNRFYMYVARNIGAEPKAAVNMIWTRSLDPKSPDYKWHEGGVVASSNGVEDSNAIDPGVFLDSTTGRMWLTYGSFIGYIRLVELNPKTGQDLVANEKPIDLAINGEASDMIYHAGWYYLFMDRGSCCAGSSSGYNIRMGRSRKVTGPFVDADGVGMIEGGGTMLIGSEGRFIGPGHFGLINLGDGVEKFSMHWEADLDHGGASVLGIRPLLWKNGWPEAGENFLGGTFEIQSVRTGTALDIAVEGVPVGGPRTFGFGGRGRGPVGARRGPGGFAGRGPAGRGPAGRGPGGAPGRGFGFGRGPAPLSNRVIPDQQAAQVDKNWPAGTVDAGMANYLAEARQKWQITPVPDAGGYIGGPYFKITIAGTDRALAATTDAELAVIPAFTGAPEQLWRFDQLTDGTWRIMPKAIPNWPQPMALSAVGSSFATLDKFNSHSDMQRWLLKTP